jgi:putative heme iron utilization protein
MVAEIPEAGDALTGARVTVMGRFARVEDEALRRRYLARHPAAELYAGFGDFAFWRLLPERAHAVAGFGRIETIAADEMFPSADEMTALEAGAIAHMNEDHDDAIQRYASKLLGATPGGWKIVAIDPDGADLQRGEEVLRLPFPRPAYSGGALRKTLADLGEQTKS